MIVIFFADANGDLSGDEQSISSGHQEVNDENSMDSDRGGALNLVRRVLIKGIDKEDAFCSACFVLLSKIIEILIIIRQIHSKLKNS